jgi:glycine C-acetyltransferase
MGFDTGISESPITPVIAGESSLAMKLSDRLFEEGVFAQGIAFPTVARDKARVRTIVTATHTKEELQFALDAFNRVGAELGLI